MKGVKLVIFLLPFFLLISCALFAQEIVLQGHVTDPQGNALPNASLELLEPNQVLAHTTSGPHGQFLLKVKSPGDFVVKADAPGFRPVTRPITIRSTGNPEIEIQMTQLSSRIENVTVTADVNESDVLSPDPGEKVFIRQELLDANPGRPGAPVSVPGYPIETASSGIKAPQYFAPGVAGDHGEPIAQYYQIGNFLYPNNLPANAHGNGYSDPNFLIAPTIDAVTVDGGAFNVREGNHSVDLAAAYVPRQRLDNFIELTGDYRDIDLVAGWSPSDPDTNGWMAAEASFGNGYLDRLGDPQQYKINRLSQL